MGSLFLLINSYCNFFYKEATVEKVRYGTNKAYKEDRNKLKKKSLI